MIGAVAVLVIILLGGGAILALIASRFIDWVDSREA